MLGRSGSILGIVRTQIRAHQATQTISPRIQHVLTSRVAWDYRTTPPVPVRICITMVANGKCQPCETLPFLLKGVCHEIFDLQFFS